MSDLERVNKKLEEYSDRVGALYFEGINIELLSNKALQGAVKRALAFGESTQEELKQILELYK